MSIFSIPWVQTLLFIIGGILGGMILGWIIGKIIARVKYPDPNKTRLYSGGQLLIVMAVVVVAIALILVAVLYQFAAEDPSVLPAEGELTPGVDGGEIPAGDGEIPVDGGAIGLTDGVANAVAVS
ncbi:MAG: hypothetical protein PHD67_00055 [Oscillospiraceae bacterium]|nr:hypothetical protein [Oscillospiraceae bacterium]